MWILWQVLNWEPNSIFSESPEIPLSILNNAHECSTISFTRVAYSVNEPRERSSRCDFRASFGPRRSRFSGGASASAASAAAASAVRARRDARRQRAFPHRAAPPSVLFRHSPGRTFWTHARALLSDSARLVRIPYCSPAFVNRPFVRHLREHPPPVSSLF